MELGLRLHRSNGFYSLESCWFWAESRRRISVWSVCPRTVYSEYITINWLFALFATNKWWRRAAICWACKAFCWAWKAFCCSRCWFLLTKSLMYAGGNVLSPLAMMRAKYTLIAYTIAAGSRIAYLSLSCCLVWEVRSQNQQRVAKTSEASTEVPKPQTPHHNSHSHSVCNPKPWIARFKAITTLKRTIL